jgi:O-antigen/teichoic acid export membrane protein
MISRLSWNLLGQGGVAFLGLVLIKLSVSTFSVPVYGAASLLLGLQAFAKGMALNPVLNLAIYATPREGAQHGLGWVYRVTRQTLWPLGLITLPLFALAAWAMKIPIAHLHLAILLLFALLVSDSIKTARLNLLHCRDRAKRYALWSLVDAAAKPGVILAAAHLFQSRGPLILLGGHVAATLLILTATSLDPEIRDIIRSRTSAEVVPPPFTWIRSHRAFLAPLLGLGLTGWITGVGDRYLVNLFLGAHAAGLYIGLYAIFASPFLVLNGVFMLALRPTLMRLQMEEKEGEWKRMHRQGMAQLAGCALLLALALYLSRTLYVKLLLAPAYVAALAAAPGILAGNAIQSVGTLLELAFFLRRRSGLALLKQGTGSFTAMLLAALAIPRWGLSGAGWACLGYATLEFLIGSLLLRRLQVESPIQQPDQPS